jgi:hypothetical protein
MDRERSAIAKKAKAKQARRQKSKTPRSKSKSNTGTGESSPGITEKMIDLGQDAAAQVSALVKTAVKTITGGKRKTAKRGSK